MGRVTCVTRLATLIIANSAFQRTGGIHDLRNQMDDLSDTREYSTKNRT